MKFSVISFQSSVKEERWRGRNLLTAEKGMMAAIDQGVSF